MIDVHCDAHRSLPDKLIASSTARLERSTFLRGARFLVPLAFVVASLAAVGCASRPRCKQVDVPFAWSDGTVAMWHLTVCRMGKVTVKPTALPLR